MCAVAVKIQSDLHASSGSHNKSKGDYGINKANLFTWHLKWHAMQARTQMYSNVETIFCRVVTHTTTTGKIIYCARK